MKRITLATSALLLSLLLLGGCNSTKTTDLGSSAAPHAKYLSDQEIKNELSGKTFTWRHTSRDDGGKWYFSDDGKAKSTKNGFLREGEWKVSNNKLILGGKFSRSVERDSEGTGYYLVKNGEKRVIHFTNGEQGDTVQ